MMNYKFKEMKEPINSIEEFALAIKHLALQAVEQYSLEVELIISSASRDNDRIEHLLDGMLDFCYDERMLLWYKKLCRYYFSFNPDATACYINAYREMWDDGNNKIENQ